MGAAERGRIGVLEKGKQGALARASGQRVVFGGAGRARHATWPCQREGALAAGCQVPRARAQVGPTGRAADPQDSGATGQAADRPRAEG